LARGSMSNLDVAVWVRRAQGSVGCRVDNIYTRGEQLLLKLRAGGNVRFLLVEAGVRIHFTSRTSGLEEASRGFALQLKRLLRDRRLIAVEQLGFDRVVKLTFSGDMSLYAELLPRGVVALVDGRGVVVAASRSLEARDRVVKPGLEYRPPPLQLYNPFLLDASEIASRVSVGSDVVRGLVRGLGLPGEVAEEVVYRASLEPKLSPRELSVEVYERLRRELEGIYTESMEGRGYLILREGAPVEATPFKPRRFPAEYVVELSSLDEALDELFSIRLAEKADVLEAERAKLERSLAEARELEARYKAEAESRRALAEILARNYDLVESTVECVAERWRLRDLSSCGPIRSVDFNSGFYEVEVEGVLVRLRYGERVQEAITRLFREAGELEGKARRAREAIAEALGKLGELELKAKARLIAEKAKARRVAWFERFRWTITTNGFLAIGGRDASQNESLVRRYLGDEDLFLHADIQGGSAVILKTRGLEPKAEDIEDAALIAACYSKAWKAGLASIDVYWVRGSQVSKSAPPGEYLKTGAFMVYGERNYVRGVRLQLAIGLATDREGNPLLIAGSERVVRRLSKAYLLISPGDISVEESQRVKEGLLRALASDLKPLAMALDVDEIKSILPGRFRILRVNVGEGLGLDLKEY